MITFASPAKSSVNITSCLNHNIGTINSRIPSKYLMKIRKMIKSRKIEKLKLTEDLELVLSKHLSETEL